MKNIFELLFVRYGMQKMIISFIIFLILALIVSNSYIAILWNISLIFLGFAVFEMLIGIVYAWIVPLFKKKKRK